MKSTNIVTIQKYVLYSGVTTLRDRNNYSEVLSENQRRAKYVIGIDEIRSFRRSDFT